jgi:hypothetical protein
LISNTTTRASLVARKRASAAADVIA